MKKLYTILSTILLLIIFTSKVNANTVYPHHLNLWQAGLDYFSSNTLSTQAVNCYNNKCENSINGFVSLDSLKLVFNPVENQETEHAVFNGYIQVQNLVPVGAGQPSEMPSIGAVGLTSSDHVTPMGICVLRNINANNPTMGSVGQTTNSTTGVTYNIYQSTINFQIDCYLGDTRLQHQYDYDLQFFFNNGQGLSGATFNVTSVLNYYYASYDGEYNNNLDLIRQAIENINLNGATINVDQSDTTGAINQQTQDIIDNQNDNTQDIIDNQNANSEAQIESQKVCYMYDLNSSEVSNHYLNVEGELVANNTFNVTKYVAIHTDSEITILNKTGAVSSLCFYNVNKQLISCQNYNPLVSGQLITIPNNSSFVRFSINNTNNRPQFKVCNNGNQALSDSLQDVNNSLNNSNTSEANSSFSSFVNNFHQEDYGFSDFFTLPLRIFSDVLNSVCHPLSLRIPYLKHNDANQTPYYINLPCYEPILDNYFDVLLTLNHLVVNAMICYYCFKEIFRISNDLVDPTKDNLDVFDL